MGTNKRFAKLKKNSKHISMGMSQIGDHGKDALTTGDDWMTSIYTTYILHVRCYPAVKHDQMMLSLLILSYFHGFVFVFDSCV